MKEIEPSQTMTAMQAVPCLCQTKPFMTVEAAALILDISEDYLHVGIRKGRIPAHRFGRAYRLRRDFIYGFVATPSGARFEDYAATWLTRMNNTEVVA